MKVEITYRLDGEEETNLSMARFEDLRTYVDRLAPEADRGEADGKGKPLTQTMHPGMRAARKVTGGTFTSGDVAALVTYVGAMASLAEAKADEVEREGEALLADRPDDAASRQAYAWLAERLRSDAARARRDALQVRDDFAEEVGMATAA